MPRKEEVKDPKYQSGKVYKIQLGTKVYIGSTTMSLKKRFTDHKSACKSFSDGKRTSGCASFQLFESQGQPKMHLLEAFPCSSKNELEAREEVWRKRFLEERDVQVVNMQRAFQTVEERIQYYTIFNAEYYQANRETILARFSKKIICPICKGQTTYIHIHRHQRSFKCQAELTLTLFLFSELPFQ
jgi:hypothetical protein